MKYLIKEEQFRQLIEKKKVDKIVSKIYEDFNKIKKSLKSQHLIEESIKDRINLYQKRGLLTSNVIKRLNEENFFEENSIIL